MNRRGRVRGRRTVVVGAVLLAAVSGTPAMAQRTDDAVFRDGTEAAGIAFEHVNGAFGDKWMPESLGSGVAVLDADGDGLPDLLFVQGTTWPGHEDAVTPDARAATMALYRNRGDGTFAEATAGSGLDVQLYGFGAAPADFDGDGDTDVLVTAYGPDRLFRNEGDGTFVDVSEASGLAGNGWSTSAAWFDYDGDRDLDVYIAGYVRWNPAADIWCSLDGTVKSYCTPESYEGEPSRLYRNEGDGRFTDVSREAGVFVSGGKSLGVTVADFNGDGAPDFAVANDTEPNFLFQNRGDGTFEEVGLLSGMAFDSSGRARAGMGVDVADLANAGKWTLAVGNFSKEMIGLFEQGPGGLFIDVAARVGVGRSSFPFLTFGLFFFDYDLDGWSDLFAANGHLEESINEVEPSITYAQRALLYRNRGDGTLAEIGGQIPAIAQPSVGRGAAYADLDGDGDLDVIVTSNGGAARVFENRTRDVDAPPHVVRVQLRDAAPNRAAVGALIVATAGGTSQRRTVRSGASYASHSELVATFGLGSVSTLERLEIRWPDGEILTLDAAALAGVVDAQIQVDRSGIVERRALTRRER